MRSLQPIAALLAVLAATAVQAGDWRLHAKCSACRVVADELEARLDAEQPRNHLDLRHRLGKDGKRWGKVIDYKLSELRVIHLLDGLCAAAKQYQLVGQGSGAADGGGGALRWAKSSSLQNEGGFSPEVTKQHRKELEVYCHDLLERYEEELSSALRDGQLNSEAGVSDWLCLTTARHCHSTRAEEAAAAAAAANQAAAAKEAGDAAGASGGGGEGAEVKAGSEQQGSAAQNAEL